MLMLGLKKLIQARVTQRVNRNMQPQKAPAADSYNPFAGIDALAVSE